MTEIKGIYAASLSILDENLALNIEKTISHAENLINLGCHGVAIFGSTGQSQLISLSEKIQLINELSKSEFNEKYIMTNVIFCHIISSNFFYRKRDYDKCYDQHKVTRKRDRETGLNTLKYDVINNAPMTINDIPFTIMNVTRLE